MKTSKHKNMKHKIKFNLLAFFCGFITFSTLWLCFHSEKGTKRLTLKGFLLLLLFDVVILFALFGFSFVLEKIIN